MSGIELALCNNVLFVIWMYALLFLHYKGERSTWALLVKIKKLNVSVQVVEKSLKSWNIEG